MRGLSLLLRAGSRWREGVVMEESSLYKHDIFVSYAHVDNAIKPGIRQGWITSLALSISETLKETSGRSNVKVWMDYQLSGNEPLTEQLLDNVRRSATLLVIQSPGYVNSSWCSRERNAFLEEIQKRRSSVFVVERRPIDPTKRPLEFLGLRGYKFWAQDPLGQSLRLFGDPTPHETDKEYYSTVDDICRDLTKHLAHIEADAKKSPDRKPKLSPPLKRRKVFLAQVTEDLTIRREEVKRYLSQIDTVDIEVVPSSWYPFETEEFCAVVTRDLEDCDLFVQLLSQIAGRPAPGCEYGYAKLQFDLACAAGKQIFQWRDPDIDLEAIEDVAHRALLNGKSVWAEPLEEFKAALARELTTFTENTKRKPNSDNECGKFIFVNRERDDAVIAERVSGLLDDKGCDVYLPLDTMNSEQFRKELEEHLTDCDGLIVVYGDTTPEWVRQQLFQCRKAFANRKEPLKALALCEFPPTPKVSPNISLRQMRVFDCNNGGLEVALDQFLSDLAAG